MKNVFSSHSEVAHIFAQRTQNAGRGGSMFFDGNTIYSYGRHFPIATIHVNSKGTLVLFNSCNYSNSTCKHKNYTRRALSHYKVIDVKDTITYKEDTKKDSGSHKTNIEYFNTELENTAKLALRSIKYSEMYERMHLELVKNGNEYCKFFGIKKTFKPCLNSKVIIEKVKAQAIETRKRNAEKREEEKTRLTRWLNGESTPYIYGEWQYLRLSDAETVETTKNVTFPLSHAVLALRKIRQCVETHTAWHRNGEEIRLSVFHIDEIDENGNVRAGCHKIQYSEIERFAKLNNL